MSEPTATQIQTYRAFLTDLRRANGWRLPVLIGIMSLIAFTDGLAVTLLLPLLSRVGIVSSKSTAAVLVNNVLNAVTPAGSGVGAILIVILSISACQMCLTILQGRWISELIFRYDTGWKVRLFSSVLRAEWLYLTARKGGELASATVAETARAGGAFYYFTLLVSSAVTCLIYLTIAMLVTWRATLLMVGLLILMILSISRLYRLSHRAGHRTGPLNAELQVLVNESLAGSKIIKATVSEQVIVDRLTRVSQALEKVSSTRMFTPSLVRGLFEFMAFTSMAVFFAYGMGPLHIAPADIMVVLALFVRMLPRVTNSQTAVHDFNGMVPAIIILERTLAEARAHAEPADNGSNVTISLPARLQVHDLQAGYGDKLVLKNLNLTLNMPGMIGIVGGSGAGKSTLVHVLLRLVQPVTGRITLGSHEMPDMPLASWRRQIGYVPQETMFFHASVAENLAMTRPGATREEIIAAAKLAHAHDFIRALPQGYDTPIGDMGVLLSGGQRQRLGIARALLAKPALLLMDEPTSALDPVSENEILATLAELRKTVGIVIVAHRLTTVQQADRIYVMDGGRVVEEGSWSELIARQDHFHSLAKLQQVIA